jgi:hypothetical protein
MNNNNKNTESLDFKKKLSPSEVYLCSKINYYDGCKAIVNTAKFLFKDFVDIFSSVQKNNSIGEIFSK